MTQAAEKTSFLSTYLKPLAASLSDPAVVEIAINPDGKVWVETRGAEHMVALEGAFYSPTQPAAGTARGDHAMNQITDTSALSLLTCDEGFDPIEDRLSDPR